MGPREVSVFPQSPASAGHRLNIDRNLGKAAILNQALLSAPFRRIDHLTRQSPDAI
jgi:hypothetical protein